MHTNTNKLIQRAVEKTVEATMKEDLPEVYALVQKSALSEGQLFIWIRSLLKDVRKDEREKVLEMIGENEIIDTFKDTTGEDFVITSNTNFLKLGGNLLRAELRKKLGLLEELEK